jgi:DNA-binding NarL/FixJ family response regulator
MWARTDSEGRTENIPTGGLGRQPSEQEATAKRVLLVDDHNLFREVLTILCEQHTSLATVQAGSLAEARRVLSGHNSNDFALAVVDLDLQDEGGMELIGKLYRAGIPVLALTTSRDSERLARESGPEWGEVLTTADSCDELLDAVRRIVRR